MLFEKSFFNESIFAEWVARSLVRLRADGRKVRTLLGGMLPNRKAG